MGALGLGAALAGCGASARNSSTGPTARPGPAADRSDAEKVVNWANWTQYLDFDENNKTYPSLEQFQRTTGIKANYVEDINDNETYYAKIHAQLSRGKDIGQDIVVFTDWMANRLIGEGLVQKLDHAEIPNLRNLRPELMNVPFDKGRQYSLTWQTGYTGIGYNVTELAKLGVTIEGVEDLWNPKLRNRVMVLSEMRDTIGLIMLSQGADVTKYTAEEFQKALSALETQLGKGQIREVAGNDYVAKMESGDALAVMCWSGDVQQVNAQLKAKDPRNTKDVFKFVIPKSGGMMWSDNLMVPLGAPHKKNAETLINYYYSAKVAAQVAAYVNYVCPVPSAQAEVAKLDPALAESNLIFPTREFLSTVHVSRPLNPDEEKEFTADFEKVLGL